jgi:hypothetical protein
MIRLLPLALLALTLPGCSALGALKGEPATVANQTVLDEKLAIGVELAYQAAGQAVLTLNQVRPFSPEMKERVKAADRTAYEAVVAVRAAYAAGNASSYSMAAAQAQSAVAKLLAIIS